MDHLINNAADGKKSGSVLVLIVIVAVDVSKLNQLNLARTIQVIAAVAADRHEGSACCSGRLREVVAAAARTPDRTNLVVRRAIPLHKWPRPSSPLHPTPRGCEGEE